MPDSKDAKQTRESLPNEMISKAGQWLLSNEPPFWDLSGLTPKEMRSLMREVMK